MKRDGLIAAIAFVLLGAVSATARTVTVAGTATDECGVAMPGVGAPSRGTPANPHETAPDPPSRGTIRWDAAAALLLERAFRAITRLRPLRLFRVELLLRIAYASATAAAMCTAAHERYRDALSALVADASILPEVVDAGARRGWWSVEREWRRTYGRFTPDGAAFADLVFTSDAPTQALCRVEVSHGPLPVTEADNDACDVQTALGHVRCTRFPSDPRLPGLRAVALNGATVARYHPLRRCTMRLDAGGAVMFAKVYATDHAAHVHDDAVSLWRATAADKPPFRIAEPLCWDHKTRTVWQRQLAGEPLAARLASPTADALVRRVGRAGASLTQLCVEPSQMTDGAAQLARSVRHGHELVHRVPALGAITREILDHLTAAHAEGPHRPLRPIHGSFRANQCLIDGDRVGLLDLDRFGWGDPEMDAGAFLNDLACLDRLAHPVDVLQQCFLDEYQAVAGPLRRQLLTAYGAHARLAKALRAAQALRPDGDARARRLTEETLRFLSDGVRS